MKAGMVLKNIIIFGSLFAVVYWFFTQTNNTQYMPTKAKPQEYMSTLQITNFDDAGKPKQAMQAEYWEFVHSAGNSELIKPHVAIYKPNGEVWHLSSNRAVAWHPTINDKVTQVDMMDDVVIERPQQAQTTALKLKTSELQYIPDEEVIRTKQFVSLEQPGLNISGYGLLGYLDRNWIELHDKINTVYTPN